MSVPFKTPQVQFAGFGVEGRAVDTARNPGSIYAAYRRVQFQAEISALLELIGQHSRPFSETRPSKAATGVSSAFTPDFSLLCGLFLQVGSVRMDRNSAD